MDSENPTEVDLISLGNDIRATIPHNINDGIVRIRIFYSGGTGGIDNYASAGEAAALDNDGQFILITAGHGRPFTQKDYENLLNQLNNGEDGENNHNITGFKIDTYSGSSSGSITASRDFINRLKEYTDNDNEPLYLNLYDPTTEPGRNGPGQLAFAGLLPNRVRNAEERKHVLDTMARVGTFRLITFDERKEAWKNSAGVKEIISAGVNTILISSSLSGGKAHEGCYTEAVKDGWEDYFDGTIELKDIVNSNNYNINKPSVDKDGNVVWTTYTLAELQTQSANFLSYDSGTMDDIVDTFRYLEGCRTKVDYDVLADAEELKGYTNKVKSSCDELTSINYAGTSNLLPTENVLLTNISNKSSTIIQSLNSTASSVNQTIEDYKALESERTNAADIINIAEV